MLVSIRWVRDFCPFETTESPLEVGARFSLHAAEVEEVTLRCHDLQGIVAAKVLAVRPHPDAERLRIATIDVGDDAGAGPREIVCGAPNVRKGIVVPYAPPGSVILGQTIQEVAIRGVSSAGMLCSERELGVSTEASGLWELPRRTRPGRSLLEVFPELSDVVMEIDNKSITHRPDLWGHYGIAREFAAIHGAPLRRLKIDESLASAPGEPSIRVSIVGDGVGGRDGMCRRYCGLQIDGVKVGPSPAWLQHRLLAIGSRPINNIVDVTNYILYEIGQPLHAFDVERVGGGEILVRRARQGERLTLLDDTEVELIPEDCVIADAHAAVALAGVMGGASSEISDQTTSVFLESANFSPVRIRRSSLRLGKRTDSSLRFEKSLDPENARAGILRAARLILDLCPGARVVGPLQDVGYDPPPPIEVQTSPEFIVRRLGADIPPKEVRNILKRLGFQVRGKSQGDWTVVVPSWRATKDISVPEDLVEEVGRIYGYGRIDPFAPVWKVEAAPVNEHRQLERAAKRYLALHGGLNEVYSYSMVGEEHCRSFGLDPETHLKLLNPISEDLDRMRREIVPILLEKAAQNQRYFKSFGFFELGRVYRKPLEALRAPGLPDERSRLSGLVCYPEKQPRNFFAIKELVLGLLRHLNVAAPDVLPFDDGDAGAAPWAHPSVRGRVVVDGQTCGSIYGVHPATEARLELAGETVVFDLDFDQLFGSPRRKVEYRPISRYPTVPFDVAVVAPERTPVRRILDVIRTAAGEHLVSSEVFDVFVGAQSGSGNKSVAFHLVFGSRERTLSGDEVTRLQDSVIDALRSAGYPLRG